MIFFDFQSAHEAPPYQAFSPSQFASNANDHRMADTVFFSNLCSCKGISFDNALNWLLSTSMGQPQHSSSSRLPSPLQNFLNHHYTACSLAVAAPNALLMRVVSVALRPILNSNKHIAQICFLSSIISVV